VRLAVVGSTNITDKQRGLASVIIDGFLFSYEPDVVISGGALGIDSLASGRVTAWNRDNFSIIEFRVHLPANNRWAPDGYKDRNLEIAKDCTHLLSIRSEQSTTYGSGWTADRAEEMGKTVWRVKI
jgi:hypothetical protein